MDLTGENYATRTRPKHMRASKKPDRAEQGQAKPGQAKAASEEQSLDQPEQTNQGRHAPTRLPTRDDEDEKLREFFSRKGRSSAGY